jgi:NAD+ synthase
MTTDTLIPLNDQILDLSRQNNIAPLSPWFADKLAEMIAAKHFLPEDDLVTVSEQIVDDLSNYRESTGASVVVLGMSGGVDSALTAALFKKAGYRVIGVTMPIHQVQAETDRGVEACEAIGIEHIHADLSDLYDATLLMKSKVDAELNDLDNGTKPTKIRRGNIRARLRMITLYNIASKEHGFVASTDNWSELTAGFWTLHGDVGDVSPIQSLLKSWEVPYLAKINGVPESTYRATPTDGLGIDAGDEAQLGASYLEWDIMALSLARASSSIRSAATMRDELKIDDDPRAVAVFDAVFSRIGGSWYKRQNPINIAHAFTDRYAMIDKIDQTLFVPQRFRRG